MTSGAGATGTPASIERVRHNRVELAVHRIRPSQGGERALLLLHGLGECTPATVPTFLDWPGAVLGLDFTGHGDSTVPVGGGYTSEILVGDVDACLHHLDAPVTILGRGLGGYIALLAAAARPDQVRGAVITDGPGLAGGGVHPGSIALVSPAVRSGGTPDPFALLELSRDVRPPDYVQRFVGFLSEESDLESPVFLSTKVRPAWIEAVADSPGVRQGTIQQGLELYASIS